MQNAQDWGYKFVGNTIDKFIRDFDGSAALEKLSGWRDRQHRAEDIIFDLAGKEPTLFYVRRQGQGQEPGEEIWDITLATDLDDIKLPAWVEERKKTLGFRAVIPKDRHDGLRLISAILLPRERGRADGYAVPFRLRLLPSQQTNIGIPLAALRRMAAMPVCGEHTPTEAQLQAWKAFLAVEQRIAEARQFCVPFLSHNYGSGTRRITFEIDVASATLDGSNENSLDEENFWERAKQARNKEVKCLENSPTGKWGRDKNNFGCIEEIDSNRGIIRVELERDFADYMAKGHYNLPATGFLFFEDRGEIYQIHRKKQALEELIHGRTQNPYLGNFLFDASQARSIKATIKLEQQDLLLSSANPGQKAAVEAVLAAPDLVLIQGPPGTGKTTVIAEICYQVAKRGGRTLIASQANLAVDNALSRLVHNPVIRAVRKGKADKVGEEGQPFLEDKVIGTWLQNTATDCENNLAKRVENVRVLHQVLALSERFTAYFKAESAWDRKQNLLQKRRGSLESICQEQARVQAEAEAKQQEVESLKADLEGLLSAPSVNWESPPVVDFLPRLQPYAAHDNSVLLFIDKVKEAIILPLELGLTRPTCGAFGLADWLKNTVAPWIACEVEGAQVQADNVATALIEAESSAQIYQQNLDSLTQEVQNNQEFITTQKNLQQIIKALSDFRDEVSFVRERIKLWNSTFKLQIYDNFKNCLQRRQYFKNDLIPLPEGLTEVAIKADIPLWQEHLTKCQLTFNELVDKYREYDSIHNMAMELYRSLRLQALINESAVSQATAAIVIHHLDHKQALIKLKELAYYAIEKKDNSTIEAVRRKVVIIRQKAVPNNFKPALEAIKIELASAINDAYFCLEEIASSIENELEETEAKLHKLEVEQQRQISAVQEQVENFRSDAEVKYSRAIEFLRELSQQPHLPQDLRVLVKQSLHNPSNLLEQATLFSAKVRDWKNRTEQLKTLISSLEPLAVLSIVKNLLIVHLSSLQEATESAKKQLQDSQTQLREIEEQIQQHQQSENLTTERTWWQSVWQTIPEHLKPITPRRAGGAGEARREENTSPALFDSWQQQLTEEETYLNQYQNFIQDWIDKLRSPSEQNRNQLRRIYLNNANVIGITCVHAANREFSEEFTYFDVVIIDEVSKCTPPELLIPALKGKKLVMVGDHRQLPPMLDINTLEDVAEEIGSTKDELRFLEESLFKSQFESADTSIKQMLTIQYRMHPTIMGAINQFYEHKLDCGILEPDIKRAHGLAGQIIQENHHLIWVKMPTGKEFEEKREGTSSFNMREVDVIERLCQQLDTVWAARVAKGEPKKEIAVITFYIAQLRKIDDRLKSELFPSLQIRTGTVDRFQGMERPVVIVSMVRNNSRGDVGFAKKPERVNVAFSRAQELLIIVGCQDLFTNQPGKVGNMYSEVDNVVRLHGGSIDVSHILC